MDAFKLLSLLGVAIVMGIGAMGMAVSKTAAETAPPKPISYLDFLRKLFGLGPQLREVYPHLVAIYNAVRSIVAIFGVDSASAGLNLQQVAAAQIDDETAKLEVEILNAIICEESRAEDAEVRQQLGDGSGLRAIWSFLNSPIGKALLDWIMSRN